MERDRTDESTSLSLVCVPPGMKECDAEPVVTTTGTASKVTLGPSIGVVDIGVNKSAYFLQVALPGVCKDSGTIFIPCDPSTFFHMSHLV